MKKTVLAVLLVIICFMNVHSVIAAAEEEHITIYVSPQGSDNASGTIDRPLATMNGAKLRVRELKNENKPIDVIFREGKYITDSTVKFTYEDSGTKSAPIRYMGEDGKEVVFSGTKVINASGVQKVSDPKVLNRLKENVRDKVVSIDLKKNGISEDIYNWTKRTAQNNNTGGGFCVKPLQIFYNGNKLQPARWPNSGMANILDVPGNYKIAFKEAAPLKWEYDKNIVIRGIFTVPWFIEDVGLLGIDKENRVLSLGRTGYAPKMGYSNASWYAYNVFEELDIPGEWYIDYASGLMYFYPPEEIAADDTIEIGCFSDNMVQLEDADYIEFSNLEFYGNRAEALSKNASYTEKYDGNCFVLLNSNHITLRNCKIHDIANDAVVIRGTNISVDGCEIYSIGSWGVYSIGGGGSQFNVSGNNSVTNCHFWEIATDESSNVAGAIGIDGVNAYLYGDAYGEYDIGFRVENNVMHNCKSSAVYSSGNDNLIKNNEIFNCLNLMSDAGAIYYGRKWGQFGPVIENNYIHDIGAKKKIHASAAVYVDDRYTNSVIKNNIFWLDNQFDGCGVFINGGMYNKVLDNIIIGAREMVRGGLQKAERKSESDNFENSRSLRQLPYYTEYYKKNYPELYEIYQKWYLGNTFDGTNDVENNVAISVTQSVANENGNVKIPEMTKDLFRDFDKGDLRLTDEAKEKYGINIGDFDLSSLGIRGNYKIDTSKIRFNMVYPQNGQKNIAPQDLELVWTKCKFADMYEYTVCSNREMTDVVAQGTVKDCMAKVSGLKFGKTYYWSVKAVNESIQLGFELYPEESVYSFTLDGIGELDTYTLNSALIKAQSFEEKLSDESNNFPDYTKERLNTAIQKGKVLSGKTYGNQNEVDNIIDSIDNIIFDAYENQKIERGTVKMDSNTVWNTQRDGISVEKYENGVKFNSALGTGTVAMEDKTKATETHRFKFKYNLLDNPGGFFCIGWGIDNAKKDIYSQDAFYFLVKENVTEIQCHGSILAELDTKELFKENTWYNIEIVAKNIGGKSYFAIVKDGQIIYEGISENYIVADESSFGAYLLNNMEISLEECDGGQTDNINFNERIEQLLSKTE